MTSAPTSCIRWFNDLRLTDLPLVGGKNASLGEMARELTPLGVRIPEGFAVTAEAYRDALDESDAWVELHRALDGLDKRDVRALARAGARCREIVYGAPMPKHVETTIREAWREMVARHGEDLSVAVRSSATAEDLPDASFAGQHDTYLNIQGEEVLLDAVKRCQASLFTDRAISYRIDKGFDWRGSATLARAREEVERELGDEGRILIRPSGTEPLLRLMVEAREAGVAEQMAHRLASALGDAR